MSNKIFISVASYRDPELERTIRSAIDNAYYPENLYFSVVAQDFEENIPDLSWVPNISLLKMTIKQAKGAGFARAKAMESYNNQDYFLQVDSHTLFVEGWDSLCIDQLSKAEKISGNNKIILSYFPPPFYIETNGQITYPKKDRERKPYPTKQVPIVNKRNEWTANRVEFEDKLFSNPEQSSTVLGGFIFAKGILVNELPYDPDISFFGEEVCFAMRAWTRGWDIYSPSKIIVYHFYGRERYKKIWKDSVIRKKSWIETEEISRNKQMMVLCGIEKGIFGAGNKRTLQEYERFCGQNFKAFYGILDD
jgi:Glycosyltransferase (GlcNAc)